MKSNPSDTVSSPRMPEPTRRTFLQSMSSAGVVGVGAAMVGPHILHGASPNETVNVVAVGVGGMAGGAGPREAASFKHARVVGLCDIDSNILGNEAKKHKGVRTFRDYRKMFDAMHKDFDAVTIATPDHMHGPIALAAMELGKHVYCQKPLAHNIAETRAMTHMAKRQKVVTQHGTQVHSYTQYRSAVAAVRSGAIGKITEAHLWINTSWSGPPKKRPDKVDPVPANLDWDLWLGVAPRRPFVQGLYLPYQWRRWMDFGGGTLGDMGCHVMDPVFSAMDITTPLSVRSTGPQDFEETFAPDSRIEYTFKGTDRTADPFIMTWAEKVAPIAAAKKHLPPGARLPKQGSIMIGENGMIVTPHFNYATIYRDGKVVDSRVTGVPAVKHEHEWLNACRGEGKSSTPFSYAGPLTEAVLLGTLASRFKDTTLQWDAKAMRFTNSEKANTLVKRQYAPGRELKLS